MEKAKPLTFGSLFAGIGGIDLGLERAGMTCRWQVEMDDYATRVLEKHWPDVPRYRDVRDVGAANLERVDLICGGFPCQDVSLAGKRAGLEGKRTTLWSEFARLIGELEPRWVLAENVPGLLSSDAGRFFGNILRDLAEIGYDAEWDCIPAAAVGAPHRRDRVFIIAYANRQQQGWGIEQEREAQERDTDIAGHGTEGIVAYAKRQHRWDERENATNGQRWDGRKKPDASHKDARYVADANKLVRRPVPEWGTRECPKDSGSQANQWPTERRVCRVADGLSPGMDRFDCWDSEWPGVPRVIQGQEDRVSRLKCLGNAVVPQVAEFVGRMIVASQPRLMG